MPVCEMAAIMSPHQWVLTHWGRDKMAVISQTTLPNAFSWMKIMVIWYKFHWSLFPIVQLAIMLCSTALRSCCSGGAVTVATFCRNMCAHVLCSYTFVFNFGFYPLWWCIYYHWCLYFIRKILRSCTVVFLRMSVSFTMYLVRDDLIHKWNQ